jgi:hypothetical protein
MAKSHELRSGDHTRADRRGPMDSRGDGGGGEPRDRSLVSPAPITVSLSTKLSVLRVTVDPVRSSRPTKAICRM